MVSSDDKGGLISVCIFALYKIPKFFDIPINSMSHAQIFVVPTSMGKVVRGGVGYIQYPGLMFFRYSMANPWVNLS